MDRKLLDLLVCPTTRQPLFPLDGRGLQALDAAHRQTDYQAVWKGLRRQFAPPR